MMHWIASITAVLGALCLSVDVLLAQEPPPEFYQEPPFVPPINFIPPPADTTAVTLSMDDSCYKDPSIVENREVENSYTFNCRVKEVVMFGVYVTFGILIMSVAWAGLVGIHHAFTQGSFAGSPAMRIVVSSFGGLLIATFAYVIVSLLSSRLVPYVPYLY